ncbi:MULTISPECIES: putative quinol monooxygenase [unclassified Streptomyces]|uniref:putative quinol monooxygenase n=1 Tax=unclassified Streptomyces TaxID=2593676 RepID=UPI000AD7F3F6|nr:MULTISPECIES: antibiotic biosynthesis monooxygenase [unclassified Streptomyces]AZM58197.1 antibiotic biosynthesis monooxygenase [Streptomyces sp. WAC 01438]RSM99002.1 antibiotic biosynthesis monooxygenase [Streptomyces sp. WAC 01420]
MNSPQDEAATTEDTQASGRTALIVAGRVFVPPEDVETFVAEAQATYPIAAANPGNVLISFCVEDAAAGAVTVLEQWASQEALDRHLAAPEVVALFAKWSPHMRNEVRKYDARNERDPRA